MPGHHNDFVVGLKFFCLADRYAIDCCAFWFILLQMHIDFILHSVLTDMQTYMGFFLLKTNHFFIFASSVRLACPAKVYGFKNIRFPLCIVTIQYIGSLIKFQFQRFIISKIFKLNGFNIHMFTWSQ